MKHFTLRSSKLFQSSAILAANYDRRARTLDITFVSGTTYRYVDVQPSVYRSFNKAESKGHFFVKEIKPNFTCFKLVKTVAG